MSFVEILLYILMLIVGLQFVIVNHLLYYYLLAYLGYYYNPTCQ